MKHLSGKWAITALSLALCPGAWAQQSLQPADRFRDHSASDILTFADPVLEGEVRATLSLGPTEALTCGRAAQLTNLMPLDLRFNPNLTDIEALFENPVIGTGDIVELRHTNVSCADQARLAEKGVEVRTELFSSCATATRQR